MKLLEMNLSVKKVIKKWVDQAKRGDRIKSNKRYRSKEYRNMNRYN